MVAQLQSENQRLREQLQITMEEYESSNEEMKAANEELQSINEEYRSATEELETSKEELQSVNEELQTVNTEMRNKLDETSRTNTELENLMGATEIATLYLDREMRIQRYTAGVQELFNILSVDRGRRISDLTHRMQYNEFLKDAEQVLRNLVPAEHELQREDGRWFLMRLHPYRTREDHIEGVVITFIDISQLKHAEQQLLRAKETLEERVEARTAELHAATQQTRQALDLFHGLFESNPIPTALTRLSDNVFLNMNAEFLKYFRLRKEEVIGHSAEGFDLWLGQDPQAREFLLDRLHREGRIQNYEAEIRLPGGERKNILASIQAITLDESDAIITAFVDITERVQAERQIRSLASELTIAEQDERQRISQILHDDLQQRIFAIKMQTNLLRDAYQNGNVEATQVDFDRLDELLHESIIITRNLSIDLSPAVLQGEGLADALQWLASKMNEQYSLEVLINTDGVSTRFDDTLRILLFQAVREALFNVVKHAQTNRAQISIARTQDEIQIAVHDDGQGFNGESVSHDSYATGGLVKIRHRLELMGCSMDIATRHGDGTTVVIRVPAGQVLS